MTNCRCFYQELNELTGFEMALPMNSGAEAVETAVKAARKWGYKVKGIPDGKAEIIVCANNFHGRTVTIVSFSTDEQYRDGFGPVHARIQDHSLRRCRGSARRHHAQHLRLPGGTDSGRSRNHHSARRLSAAKPPTFAAAIACCLIADEIQSGLGRTGKLFAYMHEGVRPDMVIVGKALSGGFYPVSAVLSSKEVLGVFHPGDHGSTFGGNPLGCAVARAALRRPGRREADRALRRTGRRTSSTSCRRCAALICARFAARACGSASS